jgi:UbiA prenyltransferase family
MRNILLYFNERFPIIPVILFATGYSGFVVAISFDSNPWTHDLPQTITLFLSVTFLFIFYLLRQRAIDEIRDFKHDAKNFPNRPLHRGLVTKKQIYLIGFSAFSIELLLANMISNFWYYVPVLFYAFLMTKDFFIKPWLSTHFTAHFLIHEVYFIILGYFFISSLTGNTYNISQIFSSLVVLLVAPMSVEIIRKYKPRYDPHGKPVKDTYCTVWGERNTLLFLSALVVSNGYCLFYLKGSIEIMLCSLLFVASIWVVRKYDKLVVVLGVGQFLALSFLANRIW